MSACRHWAISSSDLLRITLERKSLSMSRQGQGFCGFLILCNPTHNQCNRQKFYYFVYQGCFRGTGLLQRNKVLFKSAVYEYKTLLFLNTEDVLFLNAIKCIAFKEKQCSILNMNKISSKSLRLNF